MAHIESLERPVFVHYHLIGGQHILPLTCLSQMCTVGQYQHIRSMLMRFQCEELMMAPKNCPSAAQRPINTKLLFSFPHPWFRTYPQINNEAGMRNECQCTVIEKEWKQTKWANVNCVLSWCWWPGGHSHSILRASELVNISPWEKVNIIRPAIYQATTACWILITLIVQFTCAIKEMMQVAPLSHRGYLHCGDAANTAVRAGL